MSGMSIKVDGTTVVMRVDLGQLSPDGMDELCQMASYAILAAPMLVDAEEGWLDEIMDAIGEADDEEEAQS